MQALTGTGRLVLLALRRDRVKLPVTVLVVGLLFYSMILSVQGTYGDEVSRTAYAAMSSVSAAALAFNGPVLGTSLGSVAFTETFTFFTIFVALVTTLLIVRHTRQNEETGRAELLGAMVVGRHAQLAAALLVAFGANVLMGAFVALSFIAAGLPADGSLLAGASMTMVGAVFASIAAVAAQLTTTARAANGIAAAAIGAAFLVRAMGDMLGETRPDGLSATSGWLSWLSPIGIARGSRPFAENEWWVLGVLTAIGLVFVAIAVSLAARRDFGSGILPARRGRARAPAGLLSSLGLAWRLQRGLLLGWFVGVGVLAVAVGSVAHEMENWFNASDQMQAIIAQLGGSGRLVDAYWSFSMLLIGVGAVAYSIQALLKTRAEEASGHLELVLSTKVGKLNWPLAHLAVVAAGATLLLLCAGALTGLVSGIVTNNVAHQLGTLTGAALVYLPAVLLFLGLTMLCFGLLPRTSIAISWLLFTMMFLIVQFGGLLNLPEWLLNVSPLSHIPRLPAESLDAAPLIIMTTAAIAIAAAGLWAFRRRDVTTA